MTSEILFGLSLFLCTVVWLSDPGYLKKDKSLDFVELLDTLEASSLCPDCEVIRTPRCRHCTLCKRCVDRFDHHCPWVNNCIGKGNFAYFYSFVVTQSLYLLSVVIISSYCKLELPRRNLTRAVTFRHLPRVGP
jgi:palmitoyltransferase ZDHHC13/17